MADYITAPSNGVSTVNVPLGNDYMTFMQNNTAAANAFNAEQSQKQMDFQVAQNAKAMDFNHREAELNRNWQKMMSDTAHQREIQDLINAGLNPVLSALGGNGASVGSGSAASVGSLPGSKADADTSLNASLAGLLGTMISGQTQRDVANINAAAAMRNADVNADATKYAAGLSYSGLMAQLSQPATMFGLISRFWNESGLSQDLRQLAENFSPTAFTEALKGAFSWNNPFNFSTGSGSFNSGSTIRDSGHVGTGLGVDLAKKTKSYINTNKINDIKKTIKNVMNSNLYQTSTN